MFFGIHNNKMNATFFFGFGLMMVSNDLLELEFEV
jgi:hypothetical protein